MPKKNKNSPYSHFQELFAREISEFEITDLNDPDTNEIEVIAKFNGDVESIARELDAEAEIIYQNYAIITIDRTKLGQLNAYPEIEHLELPKNLYFEGPSNLSSSCITAVQRSTGFNLSGKDVIVAIIDSGIDYMHPDFRNEDGTSRILFIWDQSQVGNPPVGFFGGAEYNNQQINNAIQSPDPYQVVPSVDTNGHGTAVAGIAVGNGRASDGINVGVAPQADIIAVKVGLRGFASFARSTELMRAIKYVIEKAKRFQKPICINMSFGMNNGSHRGNSLFETFITEIAAEWKSSIIIPTGNEGASGHHYSGKIESNQVLDIEFFTAPGIDSFYLSLWKNFVDSFTVEIIFPDGSSSGVVGVESQTKTVRKPGFILNIFYGQPSHYSALQEIFILATSTSAPIQAGIYKLRLIAQTIVDGNFNVWLPTLEEVTAQTFFSNATIYNTLTIPSTATRVIRVAGYNDRIGNIAVFSGRGNPTNDALLPDIAAPAVDILTTKSGGGYDKYTGTSVAAPFVTGSAALMMQWGIVNNNDPFLYGERLKAFLRIGATRRKDILYPNATFGYGTLCLENTMNYLSDYQLGGDYFWLQL